MKSGFDVKLKEFVEVIEKIGGARSSQSASMLQKHQDAMDKAKAAADDRYDKMVAERDASKGELRVQLEVARADDSAAQ